MSAPEIERSAIEHAPGGFYCMFDTMTWPCPSDALSDLEFKLRYQSDRLTKSDAMRAASVLAAYRELVTGKRRWQFRILTRLRESRLMTRVDDVIRNPRGPFQKT